MKRLCLVSILMLAGCASQSALQSLGKAAVPQLDASMAEADAALKAGQSDKALAMLRQAAAEHPADKTPLLRAAQLRYEQGNYGEAISNANAALEREPDNILALSIAAVSGLRVASKALGDLSSRNNLSGSVRTEAQDLAKLLRQSLGEDVLVPGARTAKASPPASLPAKPRAAGAKSPDNANPFGALK